MISLARQAQQGLERSHRRIPAVKSEHKFIEVVLQVFGIHPVVGAIEPSFEVAEGPVNMEGVGFGVVKLMAKSCQRRLGITLPAIGVDPLPSLVLRVRKLRMDAASARSVSARRRRPARSREALINSSCLSGS